MILYDINILVMISNDKAIINIFSKGIVLPKNENSVIIYSPCACSKLKVSYKKEDIMKNGIQSADGPH